MECMFLLLVLSPIILIVGAIALCYITVYAIFISAWCGFQCWRLYMMISNSKRLERFDRLIILRSLRANLKEYRENRDHLNSNSRAIRNGYCDGASHLTYLDSMRDSKKRMDAAMVRIKANRLELEPIRYY